MHKTSLGQKLMFAAVAVGSTFALSACYYDPGHYGPHGNPGYHGRRGDYPGDRDNNPPGPRGGRGTNWENPPGPRGGPGASPDRRW